MSTERLCSGCNRLVTPEQRDMCRRTYCIAKIEWALEKARDQKDQWNRERQQREYGLIPMPLPDDY